MPGRVPLAVQANRASDLLAAVRLANEFKLRLVLVGASEAWMVAAELAQARVPVVVKPLTSIPSFDSLGATLENPARLWRAGVSMALASFDTQNSRNLRQEAATRSRTAWIATPRSRPSRSRRRACGASPIASGRWTSARTRTWWSGPRIRSS